VYTNQEIQVGMLYRFWAISSCTVTEHTLKNLMESSLVMLFLYLLIIIINCRLHQSNMFVPI